MGTSAECADETTTVVLESTPPHEMQKRPQDSLRVTPRRLPIEGEPSECEQEVVDGIVTAGRTNGTVDTAKPPEVADADVDRTATLGRDLATEACGIDEGDETEHDSQLQLQQTNLPYKESRQHNENAVEHIPSAYRLPLEGKWEVCVSSEPSDSEGDADVSSTAVECVGRPGESKKTEDTPGVESRGCERGMGERTSVDEADGDAGRGIGPAGTPNESDALTTVSIVSENLDSGGIPRVRLGCTSWRAGDVNGPGNRADGSRGQADESKGQRDGSTVQMDTSSMSNRAVTTGLSHSDGTRTYLATRDAKRGITETDGAGIHADVSSGRGDALSVETNTLTTANETQIVSIPRMKEKQPDLPMETTRGHPDEPDGCGNPVDTSSVRTDTHSVGVGMETAEKEAENVRTPRNRQKTQNSPDTHEIAMPEPASRWR